jgi:formylglycine-generating enzyme required for sulfatase activity
MGLAERQRPLVVSSLRKAPCCKHSNCEKKCVVSASKYSLRGGSWDNVPRGVRAADRLGYGPAHRNFYALGFRLARD